MSSSLLLLLIVIALATGLALVNGFNDAANAIATVIGTRVISPRNAVIMAAILNFVGALSGQQVAKTIGKGILIPEALTYQVAIAGLISIIIWGLLATYRGLPISLTHGFVAGLAGAGMATVGYDAVTWRVMSRVLIAVVAAPLLGLIFGFITMVILYWLFRRSTPGKVQGIFSKLQVLSAAFMSYTHGLNDAQNIVGVIMMALVIHTGNAALWDKIPLWVVVLTALAMGYGTATGGWRVIKTLGMKITALRPVHGFAAEFAAAAVIEVASLLGIPVSTTHCISAAIIGVGATKRLSAVRWGVAGNIVAAWIITFPLCGGLGFIIAWLMKSIL
ncbi:MAG: inorganic phosphate transporter [Chloroflexota bacterium]